MKRLIRMVAFGTSALLAGVLLAAPAHAALVLAFEPAVAGQLVVPAGTNVAINVVLRGTRTAAVNTLQFDVGPPMNGATIGVNANAADRFDESAILAQLDQVIDGSLVDNRTIALAKNNGTGIATGTADVKIGTFYLQTPSGVTGSYSVTPQSIELSDPGFGLIATTGLGTTITAVVPEPTAAIGVAAVATSLLRRRRRRA